MNSQDTNANRYTGGSKSGRRPRWLSALFPIRHQPSAILCPPITVHRSLFTVFSLLLLALAPRAEAGVAPSAGTSGIAICTPTTGNSP